MTIHDLADDQAEWSQNTFGPDRQKGPIGPLRHLEKEAKEAQESPDDLSEYADCLLLILDAARRAGFTVDQLIQGAASKLCVNKSRDYGQAPIYVAGEVRQFDTVLPPFQVWMLASNNQKPVCGWGFTHAEATADGWKNVRRLFDEPIEHRRS